MTQEIEVFRKTYDGQSIIDASQDIGECFMEEYNEIVKQVPTNEHGFHEGEFIITVTWKPTE